MIYKERLQYKCPVSQKVKPTLRKIYLKKTFLE